MKTECVKQFQPGLKYVFTKVNFLQQSYNMEGVTKLWVNKLNGRQVEVVSCSEGRIGDYKVSPKWCKCIGRLSN